MEQPTYTRDDLKHLWPQHFKVDRNEDRSLAKPFIHFPAGTPETDVWDWFKAEHARLDATEEAIVEIKTPGIMRAHQHRYPAKIVTFQDGRVFTDGVERKELQGKTIVGVKWISSRGSVRNFGGTRISGDINGVMVNIVPSSTKSRAEAIDDDLSKNDPEEPTITFGPR
jgi:hypothetical protein